MLNAIIKNKAGQSIEGNIYWKEIFKSSEDSLTSFVFERLLYLPSSIFIQIINKSIGNNCLPIDAGEIVSFEFWPSWSAKSTSNSARVEPDVFIRFSNFDLIVEAKRYDHNQQYSAQWENEVIAYYNEFFDTNKKVYVLAVGGNTTLDMEFTEFKFVPVIKCSWYKLLEQVKCEIKTIQESNIPVEYIAPITIILKDIVEAFKIHGYATGEWFSTFSDSANKLIIDSVNFNNFFNKKHE